MRITLSSAVAAFVALQAPALMAQGVYRDPPPPQYMREGEPQTLTPPPPPADPSIGVKSRFSRAYVRAHSPRIVLFWNREFTDEVATEHEVRGEAHSDAYVSNHYAEANSEWRVGVHQSTDTSREHLTSTKADYDSEDAFRNTLSDAGVRMVDRTSIMRTTGAAKRVDAMGNVQEVETDAVLGKADLTVEVTQLADDSAPGGISYRIVARDVRNARIAASFRTSGRPPVGKQPYVAGSSGFVRAVPREPRASDVGRQLAIELMDRLSKGL